MDPFLLCLFAAAWLTHLGKELPFSLRGKTSPRMQMKMDAAKAARTAAGKPSSGRHSAGDFFSTLWHDGWDDATAMKQRHRDRHAAKRAEGTLWRQHAARLYGVGKAKALQALSGNHNTTTAEPTAAEPTDPAAPATAPPAAEPVEQAESDAPAEPAGPESSVVHRPSPERMTDEDLKFHYRRARAASDGPWATQLRAEMDRRGWRIVNDLTDEDLLGAHTDLRPSLDAVEQEMRDRGYGDLIAVGSSPVAPDEASEPTVPASSTPVDLDALELADGTQQVDNRDWHMLDQLPSPGYVPEDLDPENRVYQLYSDPFGVDEEGNPLEDGRTQYRLQEVGVREPDGSIFLHDKEIDTEWSYVNRDGGDDETAVAAQLDEWTSTLFGRPITARDDGAGNWKMTIPPAPSEQDGAPEPRGSQQELATVTPITGGNTLSTPTMTTSAETCDPASAIAFTQSVEGNAQAMFTTVETSTANLESAGVKGEPISLLMRMQEAAQQLVAAAAEARGYFEGHLRTQDVVQADSTVGGASYLGIQP